MEPDLYKYMILRDDWGWDRISSAIQVIAKCDAAKQYTTVVTIDLCVSHEMETEAPEKLPFQLAKMLASLTRLQKLRLTIPMWQIGPFHRGFEDALITFQSIQTLNISPSMDWIIPMCPAVKIISIDDDRWHHTRVDETTRQQCAYDLIRAAAAAKNVWHFDIMATNNEKLVEIILESIPNVSSLAVTDKVDSVTGIVSLAPLYARFANLRTLILASVENLGVGFELPRWPTGFTQNAEERIASEKMVADVLFKACKKLDVLWMGNRAKGICTRNCEGQVVRVNVETARRKPFIDSPG